MDDFDTVMKGLEDAIFETPDGAKDVIKGLPSELRGKVEEYYNWNFTLIPRLRYRLDIAEIDASLKTPSDGFRELIHSMDWWLHLLNEDGGNWRLLGEGRRIMCELDDRGLTDLLHAFKTLFEYNMPLGA